MNAWMVFLHNRRIDTVFFNKYSEGGSPINANEVKRSLIEHDGYPPGIAVIHEDFYYKKGHRIMNHAF